MTACSAVLKCFVGPNLFAVSFLGQFFGSIGNIFMMVLPGVVSSVWFPQSEVSLASGIAYGSMALGNAIGYLLPPVMDI